MFPGAGFGFTEALLPSHITACHHTTRRADVYLVTFHDQARTPQQQLKKTSQPSNDRADVHPRTQSIVFHSAERHKETLSDTINATRFVCRHLTKPAHHTYSTQQTMLFIRDLPPPFFRFQTMTLSFFDLSDWHRIKTPPCHPLHLINPHRHHRQRTYDVEQLSNTVFDPRSPSTNHNLN